MVQMTHQRGAEWPGLPPIQRRHQPTNDSLEWLFVPQRRNTTMEGTSSDPGASVRVPIGSHAYWIRVQQFTPELCRMACRKDTLIVYEVLFHETLGITEDDLMDAVLKEEGDLRMNGQYRISDHIRTKLQILHEP